MLGTGVRARDFTGFQLEKKSRWKKSRWPIHGALQDPPLAERLAEPWEG
jgi:hypothetical protein